MNKIIISITKNGAKSVVFESDIDLTGSIVKIGVPGKASSELTYDNYGRSIQFTVTYDDVEPFLIYHEPVVIDIYHAYKKVWLARFLVEVES